MTTRRPANDGNVWTTVELRKLKHLASSLSDLGSQADRKRHSC